MDQNPTFAKGRRADSMFAIVLCAALAFSAAVAHGQSTQQPSEPAAAEQASVATVPATSTDAYFEERPQPATVAMLFGAGILVALLVTAGVLLTVRGLREDLRNRKRGYRRRSRRIDARSSRPPTAPVS